MEEPKAKSKSVSFLPDLWEKVEARASADYNGNRSSYLRELVEGDLAGKGRDTPEATSPTVITSLCATLRPELVSTLSPRLEKINQPALLGKIIEALAKMAERNVPGQLEGAGVYLVSPIEMLGLALSARERQPDHTATQVASPAPDLVAILDGAEKRTQQPEPSMRDKIDASLKAKLHSSGRAKSPAADAKARAAPRSGRSAPG